MNTAEKSLRAGHRRRLPSEMNANGINQGTSGNISARFERPNADFAVGDSLMIEMAPEMIASIPLDDAVRCLGRVR